MTFAVAANGELSDCRIEKFHLEDDLQCDQQMIDAASEAYLPAPLNSYKSASIMLAMEVADAGVVIPRRVEEDRTVISRAFIKVSPNGVITDCRSDTARPFMGRPADLCEMAVEVGSREFAPDPQGTERTLDVTLEVSGERR